jgi:predicted flap endonuclease-1-like 5' DNA nuclease
MRSDYLLYLLAAVFFMITAVSLVLVMGQMEKSLWILTTVVLGLFSAGIGYSQRPKAKTEAAPTPQMQTAENTASHVKEAPIAEKIEKPAEPTTTPESASLTQVSAAIPTVTPAPIVSELVTIRGINEKRAAQLKGLGINSIDALANASAEDLAKNLAISPKITRMWIGTAKKLK